LLRIRKKTSPQHPLAGGGSAVGERDGSESRKSDSFGSDDASSTSTEGNDSSTSDGFFPDEGTASGRQDHARHPDEEPRLPSLRRER
jgi:hypothetical protein